MRKSVLFSLFVLMAASVCAQASYTMPSSGTNTITACSGVVLDPGGTGNYPSNCDSYIIIYPAIPGCKVRLTGSYNTEGSYTIYDYFRVYNGTNTSGTELGYFYGTGTCDVTSTSGPLLVYFHSDGSVQYSGFELNISCSGGCACESPIVTTTSGDQTVSLSWQSSSLTSGYILEYGPHGFTLGNGTQIYTTNTSYTLNNLVNGLEYDFYVWFDCGNDHQVTDEIPAMVSATPNNSYIMSGSSSTITTCNATIYDNGGPTGDYSSYSDNTLIVYPATSGCKIAITGSYNTESVTYDYIKVYSGAGTSGTPLATLGGQGIITNPLISNASSGALTIVFHSDGSVQRSGYELMVNCLCTTDTTCVGTPYQEYGLDTIFTTQGVYFLSGIDQDGTSVMVGVYVLPKIDVTITGSQYFCAEDSITLTANNAVSYLWSTGATTQSISVQNAGTYSVTVTDNMGCSASTSHLISSIEEFISSINFPVMCAGNDYSIAGSYYSGNEIEMFQVQSILSIADTAFLPDGVPCDPYGCSYRSTLTFTDYDENAVVESVNDIYYVKINIEHSYIGDIYINITCPNGQKADIMRWSGTGSTECSSMIPGSSRGWQSGTNYSSAYFGQAYDYGASDKCDMTASANAPGIGWNYCWSSNTSQGYTYAADGGLVYRSANVHNGRVDSSNVNTGIQFYHPDESFSSLVGCPLNGDWYIQVMDGWGQDNGYVFGWELALTDELSTINSFEVSSIVPEAPWTTVVSDTSFIMSPPADLPQDTTINCILHFYNSEGCSFDSVVPVNVHVVHHKDTVVTTCVPCTWNGVTYSQSGDYTLNYTSAAGCDSTLTLHLTIGSNLTGDTTAVVCGSFTWHGIEYSEPPEIAPTHTYQTQDGCDSVVTLHLTIQEPPSITTVLTDTDLGCNPTVIAPTVNDFTVTDTYNSGAQVVVSTDGPQSIGCARSQTWTATYSNNCAAAPPVSVTYTWTEMAFPTITTALSDADFGCNPTITAPTESDFTVSDECNSEAHVTIITDGQQGTGCAKSQTWTATYTNQCGQSAEDVSVTYTWTTDNDSPVITGALDDIVVSSCDVSDAPLPVNTIAELQSLATGFSVVDECTALLTLSSSDGLPAIIENTCNLSILRTYTITDECGNSSNVTQNIIVNHPDEFSLCPADTSASVPCLLDVSRPVASDITDVCGRTITPVFMDSTAVLNENGTGTVVFRYRYTDCAGHDSVWVFTYVLNPTAFTPIADADTVVHCMSDVSVPSLPSIVNCGDPIILTHGIDTGNITGGCGDTTFVYHYTVNGIIYTWTYTYHVSPEDFEMPENSLFYVQCVGEVNKPDPPVVTNYCGDTIQPVEQPVDSSFNGCFGLVFYSWNYADCFGHEHTWSCSYHIADSIAPDFTVPADINICRSDDGSYNADSSITGSPTDITDNCVSLENVSVTYRDSVTSHILQRDTLYRMWTLSDNCQSSAYIQRIFINPVVYVNLEDTICYGEQIPFAGQSLSMAGTYNDTSFTSMGCDSITTMLLTVNYPDTVDFYGTLCVGERYNNHNFDFTPTYPGDTILGFNGFNVHGCDSTVHLHITVHPIYDVHLYDTVCMGVLYAQDGFDTLITSSGDYDITHNETTIHSCDSIVTLHLHVHQTDTTEFSQTHCEVFTWNDSNYYETGDYVQTFTNRYGCDSVVTLHLVINNPVHTDTMVTAYDSYVWNGEYYDSSGVYTFSHLDANSCTQVDTLHLNMFYTVYAEFSDSACMSYTWNDQTYNVSGDYVQMFQDIYGADSIVTLHLIIFNNVETSFDTTVCERFDWNSETYTQTGDYDQLFQTVHGCDSLVTVHLTVHYSKDSTLFAEACNTYQWNELTYNVSGDYEQQFQSVHGCDSIVTLHLTIHQSDTGEFSQTSCYFYTWNDSTYHVSGDYVQTFANRYGCDSIVTLHLTINDSAFFEFSDVSCNSYTWNDSTYTVSGDYVQTFTSHTLCDSVVTLHLTLGHSNTGDTTAFACEVFDWYEHTGITTSGDYTHTFTNASGCDSVVTLHLTVFYGTHNVEYSSACENFEWHGVTYAASDVYWYEYTNENGCPSADTLYLNLYFPEHTAVTMQLCEGESYFWNDALYTRSNTYLFEHLDDNGCTQVDTLHLTVVDTSTRIISLTNDFCDEKSAILEVQSEMDNYIWSTGETSPTIIVYEEGIYTVTASQGDCEREATYNISSCEQYFLLPNAITPSRGDGLNDWFTLPENAARQMRDFKIIIFNRWGEQVFYSTDKNFRWNGEINGKIAVGSVFNYIIHYTDLANRPLILRGSITVL